MKKKKTLQEVYLRHLPCSWNIQPWSHKYLQVINASKSKTVTISSHASTYPCKRREKKNCRFYLTNKYNSFYYPFPSMSFTHNPRISKLKMLTTCLMRKGGKIQKLKTQRCKVLTVQKSSSCPSWNFKSFNHGKQIGREFGGRLLAQQIWWCQTFSHNILSTKLKNIYPNNQINHYVISV